MTAVRPGIEFEGTPAVQPTQAHAYWTLRRAAQALGAQLVSGPRLDDRALSGVSTDTRTLTRGALFVALRGANHDAHDWLEQARDAGAAAVVVERPEAAMGLGLPVLVVHDTLAALGLLGHAWRRVWGGAVVAVGGSNGKTSTKEMLRAVLSARFTVHATAANYNNLVGVPLTLLAIPPHADIAVVEVGTNAPGEIAQLRVICEPDVAVVTSIGEEHLEGLGDLAGVLREEGALFHGVSLAIVPSHEVDLANAAEHAGARSVVRAGLDSGDVHATRWELGDDGHVRLQLGNAADAADAAAAGRVTDAPGAPGAGAPGAGAADAATAIVPMRGEHQGANAMLALAVASQFAIPMAEAAESLSRMVVPAMRGGWESIGALTVINDAYNANPPSMRAALALMRRVGKDRQRVAVLGTMRELGAHSDAQHDAIARDALDALDNGVDIVVAVGEFAAAFERVAPGDQRVMPAVDPEAAWECLQPVLARNAMVLLKGSRGVRLERVLPPLISWATS